MKSRIILAAMIAMMAAAENRAPAADEPAPAGIFALRVNGVRLGVDDGGRGGVPVLFVHGLAGDASMWNAQLRHLRLTRRAVALDLRGHSRSDFPRNGECSIPTLAADITAAAEALGLGRYVLVGHSLGGSIILEASRLAPGCVAGLLMVDPAGDVSRLPAERRERMLRQMRSPDYQAFMEGWFGGNLNGARPETAERVRADLHRTPHRVISACYAALAAYDPVPALLAYPGPMLTVVRDFRQGPRSFQTLRPDLQTVVLAGTSHWLMMDDPDSFNGVLDSFLDTVD